MHVVSNLFIISGYITISYIHIQVGKTTLMVKYVENKFDEDYIQTLG